MKAILEFNLPEDQEDFDVATKAWKYQLAASNFRERSLHSRVKYDDTLSEEQQDLLDKIYDEFFKAFEGLEVF